MHGQLSQTKQTAWLSLALLAHNNKAAQALTGALPPAVVVGSNSLEGAGILPEAPLQLRVWQLQQQAAVNLLFSVC